MVTITAIVLALLFSLLALLHVHWAFGGSFGTGAVVPESDGEKLFEPGPVSTSIVAALLFAAALLVSARAGLLTLPLPSPLTAVGTWVMLAVFLARSVGDFRFIGFFKKERDTRFARWDTRLFSPLCLAVAAGLLLVNLN
ncbi:MAG: DUF3995 domain-containing protein [Acidobacteriota bacterium]|nr:DUF3995 domain-containing protein [Acidobacteriota bacterium]